MFGKTALFQYIQKSVKSRPTSRKHLSLYSSGRAEPKAAVIKLTCLSLRCPVGPVGLILLSSMLDGDPKFFLLCSTENYNLGVV